MSGAGISVALVRRIEWVAYLSASSPMLLTHWETRRAYWSGGFPDRGEPGKGIGRV
jgi:hypothetical protein